MVREVEAVLRKMGNSTGLLIPKPILAQLGLEGKVELSVRDGWLEVRPHRPNPRSGWDEDAKRIAAEGDDALVWPEFANQGDDALVW